jgi:DNA-binding SARP family transcriptional activator/streptogramin lyase
MLKVWLLGPARFAVEGEEPRRLKGMPAARLLAHLALNPGKPHHKAAVAQTLWGVRGADDNLRQAIKSLRLEFGDDEAFKRHVDSGYGTIELRSHDERGAPLLWVDATEFDRLRHEDPESAVELADGEFLAQFPDAGDWVERIRRRYRERVADAWVDLVERYRSTGRTADALAAAERRLDSEPADQATLRALMRLHALEGRPEKALAAYEAHVELARGAKVDSAETERLAHAIRSGELVTAGAPRAGSGDPREADAPAAASVGRVSGRRRAVWLGAAGAALVLAGGAVALLAAGDDEGRACGTGLVAPLAEDTKVATAPASSRRPRTRRQIPVGVRPAALAVGREGVWVAQRNGVTLIDPANMRESGEPIVVGGPAYSVALARDRMWVMRRDGHLVEVDRHTRGAVGEPIKVGVEAGDVAIGFGSLWVNLYKDGKDEEFNGRVARVDPCTREVSFIRIGREADTVKTGFGSVWITDAADGQVVRLDPRTNRVVARISGVNDPQDLLIAAGAVWVTQYYDKLVQRIDPETNRLVRPKMAVGSDPAGLALGAGAVWVPQYANGRVTRVDLKSLRSEVDLLRVGKDPTDVAVGFGKVWVPNNSGSSVSVIEP